jgi:hypothetical protein
VKVGRNGYSVEQLRFNYSFVVVPSQKKEIIAGSVPAVRVTALSGGNYWGQASKNGVAKSLKEIFLWNFESAFDGTNVQDTIRSAIEQKIGPYA